MQVLLQHKTAKAKRLVLKYGDIWNVRAESTTKLIIEPQVQENPKRPYARTLQKLGDAHFKFTFIKDS